MRKNYHKKLLGVLGLSAVAMMTAVASAIPAPAASATSISDTITITVVDSTPSARITNIIEGQELDSYTFRVEYDYDHLVSAALYLSYDSNQRGAINVLAGEEAFDTTGLIAGASGSSFFDVNLGDYTASSRYTIYLEGTGIRGQVAPDSVNVTYYPISTEDEDIVKSRIETTHNPVVEFKKVKDDVAYIEVMVANEDGALVEVEDVATGERTEYLRRFDAPIDAIELDFAAAGITKSGNYSFIIRAYNVDEQQIGAMVIVEYPFEALPVPDLPDTGFFLGSLNLAREDYAATGLIVFGGAILLAILVLRKKARAQRK